MLLSACATFTANHNYSVLRKWLYRFQNLRKPFIRYAANQIRNCAAKTDLKKSIYFQSIIIYFHESEPQRIAAASIYHRIRMKLWQNLLHLMYLIVFCYSISSIYLLICVDTAKTHFTVVESTYLLHTFSSITLTIITDFPTLTALKFC